ncbi:WecB/TagA/CpsF family glycosyltransferase [Sulfoacidibacillus ferrooxidans]|nr:WecB/TagA/CpsF family glycosyltransferase [Sulfoacidibacillus ferrooxidans]
MERVGILGVPFSALTEHEVMLHCVACIESQTPHMVITAGPEFVMRLQSDPRLRSVLTAADLITPDGIGIVIASRWYGQPIAERVTGVSLTERLLAYAHDQNLRVYFLGATEEALQKAMHVLRGRYQGLNITGKNGYFTSDQVDEVLADIMQVRPHILFVGLGQPRQEEFIATYKDRLGVPLAIGIGGVIDVLGGTVKRAPVMMQRLHLEWFYRLLREPSRWRRQLVLPQFALAAWLDARSRARR